MSSRDSTIPPAHRADLERRRLRDHRPARVSRPSNRGPPRRRPASGVRAAAAKPRLSHAHERRCARADRRRPPRIGIATRFRARPRVPRQSARRTADGPLRRRRRLGPRTRSVRRARRVGSERAIRLGRGRAGQRAQPGRDAAGRQPEVQAPVRRRRRRAERPGHRRALDHPGRRPHLDSPRRRRGPRLADRGRPRRRGDIRAVPGRTLGLGTRRPAPRAGRSAPNWVEVDTTAPVVQIQPPQVGTGVNAGKVAIAWRASDLHLPPKSVSLSWRPDQPGAAWQTIADGLENAGQFIWTVPATVSAAVPSQGRGDRLRRPSRLGRNDRHRARSWSTAADPAAGSSAWTPTPVPASGRCRRPVRLQLDGRSRGHRTSDRRADRIHTAGPSSSLTASRSRRARRPRRRAACRASSSIGTPGTIDQSHAPFETSGKL